jgi:hypothetical protein
VKQGKNKKEGRVIEKMCSRKREKRGQDDKEKVKQGRGKRGWLIEKT